MGDKTRSAMAHHAIDAAESGSWYAQAVELERGVSLTPALRPGRSAGRQPRLESGTANAGRVLRRADEGGGAGLSVPLDVDELLQHELDRDQLARVFDDVVDVLVR